MGTTSSNPIELYSCIYSVYTTIIDFVLRNLVNRSLCEEFSASLRRMTYPDSGNRAIIVAMARRQSPKRYLNIELLPILILALSSRHSFRRGSIASKHFERWLCISTPGIGRDNDAKYAQCAIGRVEKNLSISHRLSLKGESEIGLFPSLQVGLLPYHPQTKWTLSRSGFFWTMLNHASRIKERRWCRDRLWPDSLSAGGVSESVLGIEKMKVCEINTCRINLKMISNCGEGVGVAEQILMIRFCARLATTNPQSGQYEPTFSRLQINCVPPSHHSLIIELHAQSIRETFCCVVTMSISCNRQSSKASTSGLSVSHLGKVWKVQFFLETTLKLQYLGSILVLLYRLHTMFGFIINRKSNNTEMTKFTFEYAFWTFPHTVGSEV
ncbi:hypothetical protein CCUS01_00829 [Colletotrichum cuscutae]|uniref:Uncharacterized protein n=1 Tax=Colletotrichum cuscutae TaxID=1209917 RepID=A0AAI9Y4K9_9PEZI|nr:hypothetical protein CCUS01_00829 [Colletotrichum cuscutae]